MTCVIIAIMLSLFVGMLYEKTMATPMDSVMVDMAETCLSKCGHDDGREDVKRAKAQQQLLRKWRCVGTTAPFPPLIPPCGCFTCKGGVGGSTTRWERSSQVSRKVWHACPMTHGAMMNTMGMIMSGGSPTMSSTRPCKVMCNVMTGSGISPRAW